MKKSEIYPFDTDIPELSRVGGKGLSLIIMTQHGLPVPPGVILSVSFFEKWLSHIKTTPEWDTFVTSAEQENEIVTHCDALKKVCMSLQVRENFKK